MSHHPLLQQPLGFLLWFFCDGTRKPLVPTEPTPMQGPGFHEIVLLLHRCPRSSGFATTEEPTRVRGQTESKLVRPRNHLFSLWKSVLFFYWLHNSLIDVITFKKSLNLFATMVQTPYVANCLSISGVGKNEATQNVWPSNRKNMTHMDVPFF